MTVIRKFSKSAIVMLTAIEILIEHAIAEEAYLITKRPSWASPFFTNLKQLIQDAYGLIGVDNQIVKKEATLALQKLVDPAIIAIKEFKPQLDSDFSEDKPRLAIILSALGFTLYYRDAVKGNQVALINLLLAFKNNITPELITEITGKGMFAALITRITDFADQLVTAQITQENAKSNQKILTNAAVEQLNTVYTKVINVCKIARSFYPNNPVKRELFSYSKTVSAIIGGEPEPEPESVPVPTPVPQPN